MYTIKYIFIYILWTSISQVCKFKEYVFTKTRILSTNANLKVIARFHNLKSSTVVHGILFGKYLVKCNFLTEN